MVPGGFEEICGLQRMVAVYLPDSAHWRHRTDYFHGARQHAGSEPIRAESERDDIVKTVGAGVPIKHQQTRSRGRRWCNIWFIGLSVFFLKIVIALKNTKMIIKVHQFTGS